MIDKKSDCKLDYLQVVNSKDKIDNVYIYIYAYIKIEDNGGLKKYLGIDFDRRPDR